MTNLKGFIWDPLVIAVFLFVLILAFPIISSIGQSVGQHVIANGNLNATQQASITAMTNNMFLNTPDIILFVLYFGLIIASFISSSYEGANPAITLLLGLFFLIVAMPVSFAISNIAHNYLTQVNLINITKHYTLSLYLMDYMPLLNGVFIVADIIFVISKKEVIADGTGWSGAGSGGGIITQ